MTSKTLNSFTSFYKKLHSRKTKQKTTTQQLRGLGKLCIRGSRTDRKTGLLTRLRKRANLDCARRVAMSFSNATPSYASSPLVLCRLLGEQKDPNKATSMSLSTSLSSLIITALICPFASSLNGLALMAFYKNSSLRKQANLLLIAMTVADFVRSAVASPVFIAREVIYQEKLGPSCPLNVAYLNAGLFLPGELVLLAMNCERYIAVKVPIWHRVHVTTSRLTKVAVACFVVGSSVTLMRTIAEFGKTVMLVFFLCASISSLIFSALFWLGIKKRNKETNPYRETNAPALKISGDSRDHYESIQEGAFCIFSVISSLELRDLNITRSQLENPQHLTTERQNEFHLETLNISSQKLTRDPLDNQITCLSGLESNSCEYMQATSSTSQFEEKNSHRINCSNKTLTKLESKAKKLAIYLTIGHFFTRILPVFLLFHLTSASEPLMQTFALSSSLVNPLIYIVVNQNIKKACLRLLKCETS